ncbi:S1 RNA binding domain-containing protein, partial [Toxoplasma gondii ARI]
MKSRRRPSSSRLLVGRSSFSSSLALDKASGGLMREEKEPHKEQSKNCESQQTQRGERALEGDEERLEQRRQKTRRAEKSRQEAITDVRKKKRTHLCSLSVPLRTAPSLPLSSRRCRSIFLLLCSLVCFFPLVFLGFFHPTGALVFLAYGVRPVGAVCAQLGSCGGRDIATFAFSHGRNAANRIWYLRDDRGFFSPARDALSPDVYTPRSGGLSLAPSAAEAPSRAAEAEPSSASLLLAHFVPAATEHWKADSKTALQLPSTSASSRLPSVMHLSSSSKRSSQRAAASPPSASAALPLLGRQPLRVSTSFVLYRRLPSRLAPLAPLAPSASFSSASLFSANTEPSSLRSNDGFLPGISEEAKTRSLSRVQTFLENKSRRSGRGRSRFQRRCAFAGAGLSRFPLLSTALKFIFITPLTHAFICFSSLSPQFPSPLRSLRASVSSPPASYSSCLSPRSLPSSSLSPLPPPPLSPVAPPSRSLSSLSSLLPLSPAPLSPLSPLSSPLRSLSFVDAHRAPGKRRPLLARPLPFGAAGVSAGADESDASCDGASSEFLDSLRHAAERMAAERWRQTREGERLVAALTAAEREEQREQERRREERRRRLFSGEAPLTLEALKRDKELGYVLDELIQRKRMEKQRRGALALPIKRRFPLKLLRVGTELYGRVKKILPFGCRLDVGCLDTSALLHVRDMSEVVAAKEAGAAFAREAREEEDRGQRPACVDQTGATRSYLPSKTARCRRSAAGLPEEDQNRLAAHWIQSPSTVLQQGQMLRLYVKHVDPATNTLAVSTRPPYGSVSFALSPSPSSSPASSDASPTDYRGDLSLAEIARVEEERRERGRQSFGDFFVGQAVEGRVTRVTYLGLFLDINGEEDAFIHFYELHRRRMQQLSNRDRQRVEAARRRFDPVALEVLRAAEAGVSDEVEEAERRRRREVEGRDSGEFSRLAALREMFAEKDDEVLGADGAAARRKVEERRDRERRGNKWIYNVGEWLADLRVASIDTRRKRIQLSRRPASELLSRWREQLRDEQREILTPQQREGLRKEEESEEENEAMKALRRRREEDLALKVYRQHKKKMAALAREREGVGSADEGGGARKGEGENDEKKAQGEETADPIARKKAEQMRRFKSFGIDIFEEKRDEEELREAMEYLQRWRAAYAHRRMQEAAYKEKKRLQRLERKAPDEMSTQDAWRLAATVDEEIGLKDLVDDARKHAKLSGVRTLQLPDFSGRYPRVREVEPEDLEQFYPGVLTPEESAAAGSETPGGKLEGAADACVREDLRESGLRGDIWTDKTGSNREEAPTGQATESQTDGQKVGEKDGAAARRAQSRRLPSRAEERKEDSEDVQREPENDPRKGDNERTDREGTAREAEDRERREREADDGEKEGDFFDRAFEKMRRRTEMKLREEAIRAGEPRENLWTGRSRTEVEDGTEADASCRQALNEPQERGEKEEKGEEAEMGERKGREDVEGVQRREGEQRAEANDAKQRADQREETIGLPAPEAFVNVGKNPALRVLRDLALSTSRQRPAKKEDDFTEEEREAVLRDLRMHAIEAFQKMQRRPAKKKRGGKNRREREEAWANQVFLEAEAEEEEWREKVKAGYRDETDDAFDEVLSALGIEDLTEEVLEEARKRQILQKLQADRSDLAGDVKKILRSLVAQRDRHEVQAFEEAAGETVTSERDWEAKATAAQRLLFQGSEASWQKEIEEEFGASFPAAYVARSDLPAEERLTLQPLWTPGLTHGH